MTKLTLTALAALALLAGCGGGLGPLGRFDGYGYTSLQHPFRVRNTRTLGVAGPGWTLENFARDGDRFGDALDDDVHRTAVAVDRDDDGDVDETVELYRYELFFTHDRSNAEMWVRTIVFPKTDALTRLDVLLDRYVRAVGGAGDVRVSLESTRLADRQSFATRVTNRREAQLAGREAFVATVEVANVDEGSVGPSTAWQRASVVLVRSELVWAPEPRGSRPPPTYPVVLLMVLRAPPEDHDALLSDFAHLVSRVELTSSPDALSAGALACASSAAEVRAVQAFAYARPGRILESEPPGDEVRDCLERALRGYEVPDGYQGRAVAHRYRRGESPYANRPPAHEAVLPAPPELPPDVPPVPGETPAATP